MTQSLDAQTADWEETSQEYQGRWNRLVSTTNWEKGRIIRQWRQALVDAGAAPSEYAHEAWSRRVGQVSPQHVGRLRRVSERFDAVRETYPGLYWSHFCAALDWDDAEMWLEGAVQNGWSVSQMRQSRWQTYGGREEDTPRESDVVAAEWDEDAGEAALDDVPRIEGSQGVVQDPSGDERDDSRRLDARDDDAPAEEGWNTDDGFDAEEAEAQPAQAEMRGTRGVALADVDDWPQDLADAYESIKLAILRHKTLGWTQISPEAVAGALEGLVQLVHADGGEAAVPRPR